MDFKSFFENLKEKIVSLYEKIAEYCRENKRNAILFTCLGVSILLLLILLLCLPHNKKEKAVDKKEIVLTEQLLVPDGPEIHTDYSISRETKDKWDDEQTGTWFVIPGQKDIDSLEKANDNIINDIIGAAP